MEAIKEEKNRSPLEPFPDHDAIPDIEIVDQSPNPEAEKEKQKQKPRKKLRFQRIRGSVASELSDGNDSLWIEPERPIHQPEKWRMSMLEDHAIGGIPGSITLFDDDHKYKQSLGVSPSAFSSHLPSFHSRSGYATPKTPRSPVRKRTRNGKIVLEPQPDDSHNDPLNWRTWKKCFAIISLGLFSLLGGAMSTVLSYNLEEKSKILELSRLELGVVNGISLVGIALGSIFFTPIATIYGKRLVYLICAWLHIMTSIWAAFSPSYPVLAAARVVMGMSVSPAFCSVPASVAELFHLHQRGTVISIYLFFLLAGVAAGPSAGAAILSKLEWNWIFWISSVAAGLSLLLIFLFVPESYWDRTLRPVHTKSCIKSRSRANSGKSFRSYFSHCTCPIMTPPEPHPGKLVTYEPLSPGAIERRAQAHRDRAVQRYYEDSAEEPQAAGAIISPPLPSSTSYKTARSSPNQLTVISPRPFEDPRAAPSPPSRPPSAYIASSLNAHSSFSNPLRTTAHVDFASPPTNSPPRFSPPTRSRSTTKSSGSTLVPSRTSNLTTRTEIFNPYRPPHSPPSNDHRLRSRPTSISSQTSTYSRASSPPSPLSRSSSHHSSSQASLAPTQPPSVAAHSTTLPSLPTPFFTAPETSPFSPTSLPYNPSSDPDNGSRPSLRLDLEHILLSRASIAGFTDHTGLSGYQNGSYFRTFHSASCAGLTTPGRSAFPGSAYPGFGRGEGALDGAGARWTERKRERGREGWRQGLRVWQGRLSEEGYLVCLGRPGVVLGLAPGVGFAAGVWAVCVGGLVVLGRAVGGLLRGSGQMGELDWAQGWGDYGLGEARAAGMGGAVLLGVLLGLVIMGPLGDLVVRGLSRRNRGVYEPEFRLVGMGVALLAGGAGWIAFGFALEEGWVLSVAGVFLGLIGMGCAMGAVAAVTYVVDCVSGAVAEGMVVLTVVMSLCHGLVMSLVFDMWLSNRGPKEVFLVMGCIHIAVLLTTVPMYIFGKKARAWGARKTLFEQM
ncbi:hypothetical protein B9Z65_1483 [Elsinoe australis]|uniref:Major facilitator superfamily (MFS) profile domain-containing protein n=1 Tax=Elsinoe australis TaxID=40998 RepID=A0A2P7YG06_9PEZI|nr:hypothetical protein B9Z65_1483 [Elsinoe australis]